MIALAEKPEPQEKTGVSLPVKIEAHTPENNVWREVSHIESVSTSNAEFYLTRPLEVGQLILLKMPVKKALRRYDFEKAQYHVWGIVRSCTETPRHNLSRYHFSVAFIGQEPPASFRENPSAVYRVIKLVKDGFWEISQIKHETEEDRRRDTRYPIPIEVYIAIYDAQDNIVAHEKTVTENVSASGASVFSGLQLKIGDSVKLIKQTGGFSANAIVRNRRVGSDNLPRLHLEFVNGTFPLDGIE